MYKHLVIEYANPSDLTDYITMTYRLRADVPVVWRWISLVESAQRQYQIDDPGRFYGFGCVEDQAADALSRINQCITTVNMHKPIITRVLTDIRDQDTLNYLHQVFEIHHGLLDQQNSNFWVLAPPSARNAIAELNIAVHRCEAIARGAKPRHAVTWFGLPKTETLSESDYNHFTDVWNPGTVFLNYVEIGKTLEDLAFDNDQYITPGAFQPFRHFSADFVVRFSGQNIYTAVKKRAIIDEYFRHHEKELGPKTAPNYLYGGLPVADLCCELDLEALSSRQFVKSVSFN
jgi:hypothetical protein